MQSIGKNALSEAALHFTAGRREEAETALRRLLEKEPGNGEAWNLYAVIAVQSARLDEAAARFSRAVEADPGKAEFHANLAGALYQRGLLDEAVASCRRALRINPAFVGAHYTLGHALVALGQYDEAETAFRRAPQLAPGDALAHNQLGNFLKGRGRAEQAAACYRQALALKPDYPDACVNLGVVLKEQGRHDEARALFERALRLQPDHGLAGEQLWEVAAFWREPLVGRLLVLRPYGENAAAFLHRCFCDRVFMAQYHCYLGRGESLASLTEALRAAEKTLPCRSGTVNWVIHSRGEPERPIGLANLVDLNIAHRRAEFQFGIPEAEERHARTGVEASLLVMDFAFNRARLNKLTTQVYDDNPRAQDIALEFGFRREGHRPGHLRDPEGRGYFGVYLNGLTAADFRASERLARLSRRLLGRDVTQTRAS